MQFKQAVAFLFCLNSTIAYAEPLEIQKTIICDKASTILNGLQSGKYKEMPRWSGLASAEDTSFVIMANESTGSWTIVQFNAELACILGEGKKSQVIENKSNQL